MPKPPSDDLLFKAAELRAGGTKWAEVAKAVNRSLVVVKTWQKRYPDRWATALKVAERRTVCEAAAESVHVLRTLLRSTDEKIARDAAKSLTDLRLDLSKLELASSSETAPPLTSEAARILAFLDGHADEELARLAANVLSFVAAPKPAAAEPCPVDGAA